MMVAAGLVTAIGTGAARADGGIRTDSRAPYVHEITVYNHNDEVVDFKNKFEAQPYSVSITCGKCHDVPTIGHGWHFNAGAAEVDAGRKGEPWVYVDAKTRTQVPLSYRPWPGVYHPETIGLDQYDFVRRFGRHLPGGGVGIGPKIEGEDEPKELDPAEEELRRLLGEGTDDSGPKNPWQVSGNLEIDCMICHAGDSQYNAGEWARQVAKGNFKWAPTAAAGLASVLGEAGEGDKPPITRYDESRFGAGDRAFFDIVRVPRDERCYYCHTNHLVSDNSAPRWMQDVDVHLKAGLNCTDCHRHGIDHAVARGYEGEQAHTSNAAAGTLTCAACHLGDLDSENPDEFGGRLGAPIAPHKGLPPIHFEKLSCTACHSGPWPKEQARWMQTSLAHGLGMADEHRSTLDPPRIAGPVFARNEDTGQIEPQRAVWPAFWGIMSADKITPMTLEEAGKLAGDKLTAEIEGDARKLGDYPRGWRPITAGEIKSVLAGYEGEEGTQAVYVTGGRVHRLDDQGELQTLQRPEADPYFWPIGHDVRGTMQSLGVRGCAECHANDANLVAGTFTAEPGSPLEEVTTAMIEPEGLDEGMWALWAFGFQMRTLFKIVAFTCVLLVVLVFVGSPATGGGSAPSVSEGPVRMGWLTRLAHAVVILCTLVLAGSGYWPLLVENEHMHGIGLFVHTLVAGGFVVGLAAAVFLLARGYRRMLAARDGQGLCGTVAMFWLFTLAGIAVSLTILLTMTPLFGTHGQETLILAHRYVGVAMLIFALIHAFGLWRANRIARTA